MKITFIQEIIKKKILLFFCILFSLSLNAQEWHLVSQFDSHENIIPFDFQFLDSLHGYFSYQYFFTGSTGDDGYLLYTEDGGINWEEIDYIDAEIGRSAGFFFDFLDKKNFTIIKNENGLLNGDIYRDSLLIKKTWNEGRNYCKNISSDTVIISNNEIYKSKLAMYLPNEDTLKILKITDNYDFDFYFDSVIYDVCFINGFGAAVGRDESVNYFYHSDNTFENWQANVLSLSGPYSHLYFINRNIGFLVNNYSMLYRTDDGGNNWIQINLSEVFSINGIVFKNAIGYIIGNGGNILYSDDYGLSWIKKDFPSENNLIKISMNQYVQIMDSEMQLFTNNSNLFDTSSVPVKIKLFPNPAVSDLFICSDKDTFNVIISDINGNVVRSFISENKRIAKTNIGILSPGAYIVKIETKKGFVIKKLIKM